MHCDVIAMVNKKTNLMGDIHRIYEGKHVTKVFPVSCSSFKYT